MTIFLGIDLGASALKACLVTANGKAAPRSLAEARAPYTTDHPKPGHSEQDPNDWLAALEAALAELRSEHVTAFDAIEAISFSGGAHIGVLCDANSQPLRPAIMWSDQRADKQASALAKTGRAEQLAGNAPNPTWTLPQLIWLAAHEPDIIDATEKLYFAKDWLAAQLIGAHGNRPHVTDKTEAVGSLMAGSGNQSSYHWQDELTALSGLSAQALPQLVDIGSEIGRVSQQASDIYGLPPVPIYQGAIDTSMEWLCAAPLDEKTASIKLASAGVISLSTASPERFAPVSYYPHIIDGLHYHAAGMSDCMGAIEFVRQSFTPMLSASDFQSAAMDAPAGAEGLTFYPYLSGARAPFWDPSLTAEMRGLTRGHGHGAIARAAYEGVGHVLTAIWHDMTGKLGYKPETLNVLGGGGHSDFFCQILADMLGVTICRGAQTDCAFATGLFAAAIYFEQTYEKIADAAYQPQGEFIPDKATMAVYAFNHQTFMARHR